MGCKCLGELCSFYRGSSIPRSHMHEKGDYLYIHYGDLYKGFELRIDANTPQKPIPYISSEEHIKDTQWLRDQDIVYVLTSETLDDLGHSFIFNNPDGFPTVAGTETTIVRVDRRDLVIPAYLNYLMQTPRFKALLRQYVKGMKVFRVHPSDLARIKIDLPNLDTQLKIVAFCDALFDKQLINQRTNDYLADLLQALQKQIEGTEELAEFRADELFDIHIGKTPPRKEPEWFSLDRAGNVIWMSIKDMGSGDVYLIDSSEYLTAEAVEKHNVKRCSPGSILLSFKLTIGRVGIAANEMVTNEAIACFSSDDSRKLAYLYPLLKSYDYASLGSTSSIATAVNSRMIKAMTIKMPSSAALDRYYAQTKPIYDLLLDNTREAAALAELRDALLPKLMSGELDVSEVELSTQLNNHLCAG